MKLRTVFSFVFLLSLAGAGFYLGWVQILLPEDSYGVAFTKTDGWDSEVMRAGEFHWRWERLIPTNMSLHIFQLSPRTARISRQGELPSGSLYAALLDNEVDFSFEIELELRYRLDADTLPSLVADHGLRSDTVDEFYTAREAAVKETLTGALPTVVSEFLDDLSSADFVATVQSSFAEVINSHFPELEILSLDLMSLRVPDLSLYRNARSAHSEIQQIVNIARAEAQAEALRREIHERSRIDVLERYGRVLAEYPQLLDYFRIQGESGVDPLNLSVLQVTVDE